MLLLSILGLAEIVCESIYDCFYKGKVHYVRDNNITQKLINMRSEVGREYESRSLSRVCRVSRVQNGGHGW